MEGEINLDTTMRRGKIGFMPEQVRWEGKKTVFEQLKEISHMQNINTDLNKLVRLVGLEIPIKYHAEKSLPRNAEKRLSLACALVGAPDISYWMNQ